MFYGEILLRAFAGAFLFRGRGGVFNHVLCLILGKDSRTTDLLGSMGGRVLYAIGMALLFVGQLRAWQLAILAGAFLLGTPIGWFASLALWHDHGRAWRNFAFMTLRGLIFVAPACLALWWFGLPWLVLAIAGASCGIVYAIAWLIPSRVNQLEQGPALGEALFGAVLGAAIGA
jgi:hypothetical protein